jgi:hypothetical protein
MHDKTQNKIMVWVSSKFFFNKMDQAKGRQEKEEEEEEYCLLLP